MRFWAVLGCVLGLASSLTPPALANELSLGALRLTLPEDVLVEQAELSPQVRRVHLHEGQDEALLYLYSQAKGREEELLQSHRKLLLTRVSGDLTSTQRLRVLGRDVAVHRGKTSAGRELSVLSVSHQAQVLVAILDTSADSSNRRLWERALSSLQKR